MSDKAVIAGTKPIGIEVEAGKDYWWCSCGKSQRQPFCDGSHKGGPFLPIEFKAQESGTIWFCGCKHTRAARPFAPRAARKSMSRLVLALIASLSTSHDECTPAISTV